MTCVNWLNIYIDIYILLSCIITYFLHVSVSLHHHLGERLCQFLEIPTAIMILLSVVQFCSLSVMYINILQKVQPYIFKKDFVVHNGQKHRTVESSWNVTAHGDAWEGKWRGKWQMEWVANTLHTTSEHGVSSITTADARNLATSSRLNWRPRRFKWTRPFRRKTKSDFCMCAITFQAQSTTVLLFNAL